MADRLLHFTRFPLREQWLFPEAVLSLALAWRTVKKVPFARLGERLADPSNHGEPTQTQQRRAAGICRVIRSAARHLPFECACLQQALAARAMLRRRGIPSMIRIGVAPGLEDKAGMDSHAWLQCGELILTGREGHTRFQEIARL